MLEDYNKFVEEVWLGSPNMTVNDSNLNFIALAICEEAGEAAGKLKKRSRGDPGITNVMIAKELGDVLYYVTKLGFEIGYSLEDLLNLNVQKLTARLQKGTMKGSGDDR